MRRNKREIRVYLPFLLLLVGFGIIEFRLYLLQIVEHHKYSKMAEEEQVRVIDILPQRGIIYDSNLKPLSTNVTSFSIYASPKEIANPENTASRIAPLLDTEEGKLLNVLKKDRVFVWLKRKVNLEIKKKVENLKLPGIGFIKESKRFYPEGELASHLLGWVGIDNQGLAGVEYYYERELRGKKGKVLLQRDALGHTIPFTQTVLKEVIPGKSLILTIDSRVQSIVEQELTKALSRTKALSVEAIFMNPYTGEILALANKPDYNPNNFWDYTSFERRNRVIQSLYEPGSTFKVVTSAALMEEDLVNLEEKIYCNASIRFGDHTITDWKEFNREMNFTEIVYNSSDVGIIKLAQRMDKLTFYRYIVNFGFGQKTGIDLPGEARGIVKPPERWYLTDFPCISIGQGIAVTPLQMVVALSAVINGGKVLRPFVVKKIISLQGEVVKENRPKIVRRVISPDTSEKLRKILAEVVERGTGKKSKILGYMVGGKTGTAQIPSPKGGGYLPGRYIASFMGFAPVGEPKIAGIVVIKQPTGVYWGGEVAAPVFGDILTRVLPLLEILPEKKLLVRK